MRSEARRSDTPDDRRREPAPLAKRKPGVHDGAVIEPSAIESRIVAGLPDAVVEIHDLTGTADHYRIEVVSASFAGLSSMQRHRLVHATLKDVLGGPLHAIELTTRGPDEPGRRA